MMLHLFIAAVLLLLLPRCCSSRVEVESCRQLKAVIEGASSHGSTLTIHLRRGAQYRCTESIVIAATQAVAVVGSGGDDAKPVVLLSLTREWKELFVNKGGLLTLADITFRLLTADDEVIAGLAGSEDGGNSEWEQGKEQQLDCSGGVLVRNEGHLVLRGVRVSESKRRLWSALKPQWPCRDVAKGRVIYSIAGNGSLSNNSSVGGVSVRVFNSYFELIESSPAEAGGEGEAAFYSKGGEFTIESSLLEVRRRSPLPSGGGSSGGGIHTAKAHQYRRGGTAERELPPAEPRHSSHAAAEKAAVVMVLDGELAVSDTVFVGVGGVVLDAGLALPDTTVSDGVIGGESGGGSRSVAVFFQESLGLEGDHTFAMDSSSFVRGGGGGGAEVSGPRPGTTLFRGRSRRRHLSSLSKSGLELNQGLLLILVSVGLFLLFLALYLLDTLLLRQPNALDRFLPPRLRSTNRQGSYLERIPPDKRGAPSTSNRVGYSSDSGLSEIQARRYSGMVNTNAAFAAATADGHKADGGSRLSSRGALKSPCTRCFADQFVVKAQQDQEMNFVVPQSFKNVLARPEANFRLCSSAAARKAADFVRDCQLKGGHEGAGEEGCGDSSCNSGVTTPDQPHFCSPFIVDCNDNNVGGGGNSSDSETVDFAHSPISARAPQPGPGPGPGPGPDPDPAVAVEAGCGPRLWRLDHESRMACLSLDSLDGTESGAAPILSMSGSTETYVPPALPLELAAPPLSLPQGTVLAFTPSRGGGSGGLQISPVSQTLAASDSRRRSLSLEKQDGREQEQEQGHEETSGSSECDAPRDCTESGDEVSKSRQACLGGAAVREANTFGDCPPTHPFPPADRGGGAPSSGDFGSPESSSQPRQLQEAGPSPAAFPLSGLREMLENTHGSNATIPAMLPVSASASAAWPPPPTPEHDDGGMCYSPDSIADADSLGNAGVFSSGDSPLSFFEADGFAGWDPVEAGPRSAGGAANHGDNGFCDSGGLKPMEEEHGGSRVVDPTLSLSCSTSDADCDGGPPPTARGAAAVVAAGPAAAVVAAAAEEASSSFWGSRTTVSTPHGQGGAIITAAASARMGGFKSGGGGGVQALGDAFTATAAALTLSGSGEVARSEPLYCSPPSSADVTPAATPNGPRDPQLISGDLRRMADTVVLQGYSPPSSTVSLCSLL